MRSQNINKIQNTANIDQGDYFPGMLDKENRLENIKMFLEKFLDDFIVDP